MNENKNIAKNDINMNVWDIYGKDTIFSSFKISFEFCVTFASGNSELRSSNLSFFKSHNHFNSIFGCKDNVLA